MAHRITHLKTLWLGFAPLSKILWREVRLRVLFFPRAPRPLWLQGCCPQYWEKLNILIKYSLEILSLKYMKEIISNSNAFISFRYHSSVTDKFFYKLVYGIFQIFYVCCVICVFLFLLLIQMCYIMCYSVVYMVLFMCR